MLSLQLACGLLIALNVLYRRRMVTAFATSTAVTPFPGQDHLIHAYSQWVLLDRSMVLACIAVMLAGVFMELNTLLIPYILWVPFQTLVNFIMMAMLVNSVDKTCILIGLLICVDLYSWGVVHSSRQHMILTEVLTAKYRNFARRNVEIRAGVLMMNTHK